MKQVRPAILFIFLFVTLVSRVSGDVLVQGPKGLLHWNQAETHNGYTLLASIASTTTYLIDMEGHIVRAWESDCPPGQSVYLLENGHLLRTGAVGEENRIFHAGGSGGRVQEFTWDGELVWDFEYSSDTYLQHHDIERLPNGNILMIVWEAKTAEEAIAAGRNPETVSPDGLWADSVIEVKPTGKTTGEIVWEWHVWDHLIQEYDPSKANYGIVAEHPERIHLNPSDWAQRMSQKEWNKLKSLGYLGPKTTRKINPDWNHTNSIAYNAELDQIVLSVFGFNEIWIIDHGTTTEEAAGRTGGRYGRGGDLLYRWGNPQVYHRGTPEDQQLFAQHDAKWIPAGMQGAGHLLLFNNGRGRPDGDYSSVDELALPVDDQGRYARSPDGAFVPAKLVWRYVADPKSEFFSGHISGAQRLPNGNTLICSGENGMLFEVTPDSKVVWRYINPVVGDARPEKGKRPPMPPPGMMPGRPPRPGMLGPPGEVGPGRRGHRGHGPKNEVFRVTRYDPDYSAFAGKDLTPGKTIEELLPAKPAASETSGK